MDELDFQSLCKSLWLYYEPPEEYFDLEDDQRRECWEIRWQENNREINLRNYAERPEDYRNS